MECEEDLTLRAFETRFKDRQYIGSGGFTKVYKAFDHAQNRYVAIKVADVRPEWKQFTLQREVELVNRLPAHPNIARYDACYRFNMGIAGEIDFAILRFSEAGNLEQFLKEHCLSDEETRIVIRGILMGVSFLHEHNYIHRDLKSRNILMQREDGVWMPKIADFGLSRMATAEQTGSNSSIGLSYDYASPEQIMNKRITKRVDLWAVGVIIYRILVGELPFRSQGVSGHSPQSQTELTTKIMDLELPRALSRIKEPYQAMIRACLITDPEKRIGDAKDLIAMLDGKDWKPRSEEQFPPNHASDTESDKTTLVAADLSADKPNEEGLPTVLVVREPAVQDEVPAKPAILPKAPDFSEAPMMDWRPPTAEIPPPPLVAGGGATQYYVSPEIHPPEDRVKVKEGRPAILAGESRPAWPWIAGGAGLLIAVALIVLIQMSRGNAVKSDRNNLDTGEGVVGVSLPVFNEVYLKQELAMKAHDHAEMEHLQSEFARFMELEPDCRGPFALALNHAFLGEEDLALTFLHEAAEKAIRLKHTSWLNDQLDKHENGHLRPLSRGRRADWLKVRKAIRSQRSELLQ